MKTHPDSIFVSENTLTSLSLFGAYDSSVVHETIDTCRRAVEFVPASAYIEAIRERDEARTKLARQLEFLPRLIDAVKEENNARLAVQSLIPETDVEWPEGYDFAELEAEREGEEAASDRLDALIDEARATIAQLRTAETDRPPAPTIQPPPEWAWYLDGASPCVAGYRTEEAALAGAVRDYGEDHRLMIGQMRDVDPAELFDLDGVVERAEEKLNDLVEDGRVSACDGAAEALADWARKFLDVDPPRICDGRQVFQKKEEETRP